MIRPPAALIGILLAALAASGCRQWPMPAASGRVLVDSIHAHNALQPVVGPGSNAYHQVYGLGRALGYLAREGLPYDEVSQGRLRPELLRNYRLVFINLVSGDLPPFMVSEIEAVRDYVRRGGGLLIITDHSNCYYHAHKLAPLLESLGIEAQYETACDRPPQTLGPGNGWIAIRRFAKHPVTAGLTSIAFQSGGTVDSRFAVAWTSTNAWGDLWQANPYGEGNAPGFYGNWTEDPGERRGPLGTVLARQLGKGRIVIVADQNVFAAPFLNYADNCRLFLNVAAWLARMPRLADYSRYEASFPGRITCYESNGHSAFGDSSSGGYYNVFVALGRHLPLFAKSDLSDTPGLVVFAHDDYALGEPVLRSLATHLRSGRSVIVLNSDPARQRNGTGLITDILRQMGETAPIQQQGARVYQWPGTGQLIVLLDGAALRNETFPSPETNLNAAEQVWVHQLTRRLQEATRH